MSDAPAHADTNEPNGIIDTTKNKNNKKDKKNKKDKEPKEDQPGTFSYAFKQQILKAWQPVPSFSATLFIFIISGVFFIALGLSMLLLTKKIWRTSFQYDNQCTIDTNCTVKFNVDEDVEAPVFLYYDIGNFYQNYYRFLNSRDVDQFRGTIDSLSTASSYCNNAVTNADMNVATSYGGDPLTGSDVANPCGLFARAYFNDSYALYSSSGSQVAIDESGIAWSTDVNNVYKKPAGASSIQWTDTTNGNETLCSVNLNVLDLIEHFMVWMRAAFDPNFIKLWGRIEDNLTPGTYSIVIQNKFDVSPFGGTKGIFLSTANAFGGSNSFLAIAYLAVGGVSFFFALLSIFNKACIKSKFKKVMQDD